MWSIPEAVIEARSLLARNLRAPIRLTKGILQSIEAFVDATAVSRTEAPDLATMQSLTGRTDIPRAYFDAWYGAWIGVGGSALSCRPVDQELNWQLCGMLARVDAWTLFDLMRLDEDVVSVSVNAGASPFVNFPASPLGVQQSTLLRSSSTQRLPWRPGIIRATPAWCQSGRPAPKAVSISWFVGERDRTDILPREISLGALSSAGNKRRLSHYVMHEESFLHPFPEFLRAPAPPLPETRALYALVTLEPGNLGANDKLVALDLEVIKQGTDEAGRFRREQLGRS